MGEPGGLTSMGSHRVGHDWSDLAAAAAAGHIKNKTLEEGELWENFTYVSDKSRKAEKKGTKHGRMEGKKKMRKKEIDLLI